MSFHTRSSRTRLDLAFCVVVLCLLGFQLFVPPVLSVANDHDFEKILGHECLGPAATTNTPYFDYAVLRYVYDPEYCIEWPMHTTNEPVYWVARALDHLFYSKTDFDLRFMGIVYSLIFFAGFVTLQRALRELPSKLAALAQLAWIVIVCNAVYVPLFNSLYFDALSIATLTGTLAALGSLALRKEPAKAREVLLAALWLAVFAGSKGQHAFMALLFIPLFWLGRNVITARVVGTVAVLAGAWLSIGTMPKFYQGEATFNALFYRILPTLKDPETYLSETSIPKSWSRYTGEVAFAEDVPLRDPAYEEQFGKWFGPVELIRLYVRHPSAAWLIARENLDEASIDRVRIRMSGAPHRLSNYEESQQHPPQALSHFLTLWAALKDSLFGGRPFAYAAFILGVIACAWLLAPPGWPVRILLAAVTLSLAVEFAICMLDGADGGRHLTLFCFLLDLLVCADVVFAVRFSSPSDAAPRGRQRTPAWNASALPASGPTACRALRITTSRRSGPMRNRPPPRCSGTLAAA